ncbi:MAG: DUF389 domain-containing protein [Polyangiales bacterium]
MDERFEPRGVRDWLARRLGVDDEQRKSVVLSAQQSLKDRAFATSYWLQLFLAMGIATLGLVLDSTGVVIGAMLVAPLMGPIVQLSLGLAVSSPRLSLYSLARVVSSVVFVVLCAAIITGLLPFHETTKEILARTSPTALDLGVAAFCAVAGGYATVRAGADTAVTAAGTSIGISLVPPLCVVGFGLGTGRFQLSRGAALLFVANFSAILFFCTVFFLLLGFAPTREANVHRSAWVSLRRGLSRLSLPLLLIAVVFVPLRAALIDVTREVAFRSVVSQAIARGVAPSDIIRSQVDVTADAIRVQLVLVDHGLDEERVRRAISSEIERRTRVAPSVSVVMVADSAALRALSQRDREATPSVREPPGIRQRFADVLDRNWPRDQVGAPHRWQLEIDDDGAIVAHIAYDGPTIGPVGEALLAQRIGADLGAPCAVFAYSARDSTVYSPRADSAFARSLAALASRARRFREHVCVERPSRVAVSPDAIPRDASLDAAPFDDDGAAVIIASLSALDATRWAIRDGALPRWSATVQREPCVRDGVTSVVDAIIADASSEP